MARKRRRRGLGDVDQDVYKQSRESQERSLEATRAAQAGRCGAAANMYGAAEYHLGRAEQLAGRRQSDARKASALALVAVNACVCGSRR
jgi:hypothetical protein